MTSIYSKAYHGKHSIEESSCRQQKQKNGEEKSAKKQLINVVNCRVNTIAQYIPLLPTKQVP